CSVDPVAVPACSEVRNLGRRALAERAGLLAYQRPPAIYARGDQTLWPAAWLHTEAEGAVGATSPGELTAHIAVNSSQKFELWLYGSFDRGFEASVDGSRVGEVSNQLFISPGYARVGDSFLEGGVHPIVLT